MKRYALVVSLNLTKEDSDDPDQSSSSLLRELAVPVPRVRGQQGAAPQAAPQRGAQGRGAASLSGAFLAAGTQPHLRDHAQNDHAVVKKNS